MILFDVISRVLLYYYKYTNKLQNSTKYSIFYTQFYCHFLVYILNNFRIKILPKCNTLLSSLINNNKNIQIFFFFEFCISKLNFYSQFNKKSHSLIFFFYFVSLIFFSFNKKKQFFFCLF